MKYLDEFRERGIVRRLTESILAAATRSWTIMEICGGQTHTIVRTGLEEMLSPSIRFVHGPGCPVCVTPVGIIDQAHELALQSDVILTAFGDMLRVPGSSLDLLTARARGADVRIVYSPLDAVEIAAREPAKQVVFFAVGFETTAPATAHAIVEAERRGVRNFSILCAHVLVPQALETVLGSSEGRIQGILAAGHVCTVTGYSDYIPIAQRFRIPVVVTGFEPVDILAGVQAAVELLESGTWGVRNMYARSVRPGGNEQARKTMERVFQRCDRSWRGMGVIAGSGLTLRDSYAQYDAARRFHLKVEDREDPRECLAGDILQGIRMPYDCPAFGRSCSPDHPLGAPMVSSEGACSAYFHSRPLKVPSPSPSSTL